MQETNGVNESTTNRRWIRVRGYSGKEGRVITLVFDTFSLINVYTQNSGTKRLDYRIHQWEVAFRNHITKLNQLGKMVIIIGDLNVIPEDLCGGHTGRKDQFSTLLHECHLVDTYRLLHPTTRKYSWVTKSGKWDVGLILPLFQRRMLIVSFSPKFYKIVRKIIYPAENDITLPLIRAL